MICDTCRRPWMSIMTCAVLASIAGCVDVPDASPMGGAPMTDGAASDMGSMSDGSRPDGMPPLDRDDPDAPHLDGGPGGPGLFPDNGRPDDAEPGVPQDLPSMRYAEADPHRCPEGGALLPGLGACALVEPLDDLPTGVAGAAGAVLSNGRVLIAGGETAGASSTTESWILDADGWRAGPLLRSPVYGARAVVRRDRVFVIGGEGAPDASTTVQVLGLDDEGARTVMLPQRYEAGFTAHRLGDERLVVVGGQVDDGIAGAAEFEPLGQRPFDGLDPMNVARLDHAAVVDAQGTLWVLGGRDRRGLVRFAPEVLAPDVVEWETMPGPAQWAMTGGAVAPTGDSILFAGGADVAGGALTRAGVYDRMLGEWQTVGGLNVAHARLHLAPLGEDGAVLALGAATLEIYDPVEAAFLRLRAGQAAWRGDSVVLTVDGRVVVIGGLSQGRLLARNYQVRLTPAEPPDEGEDPEPEEETGEGREGDDGDRAQR